MIKYSFHILSAFLKTLMITMSIQDPMMTLKSLKTSKSLFKTCLMKTVPKEEIVGKKSLPMSLNILERTLFG